MGPSRHPAKHVPGCVTELEKNRSGVSRVEGSTLKKTKFDQVVSKAINLKKKVRFLYGLPL